MSKVFTIWSNMEFPPSIETRLEEGVKPHKLIYSVRREKLNLAGSPICPRLVEADIAFGQPDPEQIMQSEKLKWVHISTAGYTSYDRADLKQNFIRRGALFTNSSSVYAEPCAEHALAFMLAQARQIPAAFENKLGEKSWPAAEIRAKSILLTGQTVLLLGFGAIGQRLVELLAPFKMKIAAFRRTPGLHPSTQIVKEGELPVWLNAADHIVDLLPLSPATTRFMNAEKFSALKPGATFYNIGRGGTVDQEALIAALESGSVAAAYLDVMEPEPLPPDHSLWKLPNCFITVHTAGGHAKEFETLVDHFLANLGRFARHEPLRDLVFGQT